MLGWVYMILFTKYEHIKIFQNVVFDSLDIINHEIVTIIAKYEQMST